MVDHNTTGQTKGLFSEALATYPIRCFTGSQRCEAIFVFGINMALFNEKKFRESLPPEMLKEKRWVRYFLSPKPEGGTAKIPLGSHSDPSTWSSFDECVAAIENDQQGLGYNFLGGQIHGLDIDHCRNPKTRQTAMRPCCY